jgi:hypothetical protein
MSWIDAIKNGRIDFPNEINEIGGDADPEVIISRMEYWIECGYDISLFQEINIVSYLGRSEVVNYLISLPCSMEQDKEN